MAKVTITADFEVDNDDPKSAQYGPQGLTEALMQLGLYDIDIEVEDS